MMVSPLVIAADGVHRELVDETGLRSVQIDALELVLGRSPVQDLLLRAKHLFVAANVCGMG